MSDLDSTKLAYNKAEAAAACGVSEKTLERAVKSRPPQLLAKRTGPNGRGPFIFQRAELEAWLESLPDA